MECYLQLHIIVTYSRCSIHVMQDSLVILKDAINAQSAIASCPLRKKADAAKSPAPAK